MGTGGGLRPTPPGFPWKGAAAAAGVMLTILAVLRALSALAERPILRPSSMSLGADDGRPTLLYVFQRADCRRHAALQRRWAALRATGRVAAVGVPLDELVDGDLGPGVLAPEFPIRADLRKEAERLMMKLGYETTPVTVVFDGRGRTRLVLPPPSDEAAIDTEERAVLAAVAAS